MLRIITHINKFMDHNILIVKKLFISRILVTLSNVPTLKYIASNGKD